MIVLEMLISNDCVKSYLCTRQKLAINDACELKIWFTSQDAHRREMCLQKDHIDSIAAFHSSQYTALMIAMNSRYKQLALLTLSFGVYASNAFISNFRSKISSNRNNNEQPNNKAHNDNI